MNIEIGSVVEKKNYTEVAIKCNELGDRHIKEQDGQYVIAANEPTPEPTTEEIVARMEAETGLTRAVREVVLNNTVTVSDYVKEKAQEIEDLATPLREEEELAEPVVDEDLLSGDTLE